MTIKSPDDPAFEQMWRPSSPGSLYTRWQHLPSAVRRLILITLFYLIGPVMFSAKARQRNASGTMWQAGQRWAQVNGAAILSLLWYIPIFLFHGPLASFWSVIFVTLAHWLHAPFIAWFGGTIIIPPLPSSTLLRWLLCTPLTGLLTMGLEAIRPLTTWQTKRVISPEEQQELDAIAAAEEKKRIAQEKRKLKAAQQAQSSSSTSDPADPNTPLPPKKQRKPRTPAKSKNEQHVAAPNSLWASIDWTTVPADHPLRQAVREEAERLEAERREEERHRWLVQQYASLQKTEQTIDSTLALPAPTSPTTPAPAETTDDGYDWSQGDGSIKE